MIECYERKEAQYVSLFFETKLVSTNALYRSIRGRNIKSKEARDFVRKSPAVAIGVVAMCGVAAFVTLRSMVAHLERSQQAYYRSNRFGHLFAHVRRAPRAELARIASLPGVAAVDGWVSGNVVLDVPGLAEPAAAKVVGLLPDSPARVNRVTILRGRAPEEGSRSDVVVSEGFADANRLRLGDTLSAVVNGTWRRLRVAGVGLSPEFIYEIRPGDIFPDARRYGILWMDHRVVEADFGMTGEWNDLAVLLTPGASAPTVRDATTPARFGSGSD